jgi:hypothetical protein
VPVRTFDVESYTVLTTQSGNTSGGAWRNISLRAPSRVALILLPSKPAGTRRGVLTAY